jgi:hypothetical protein
MHENNQLLDALTREGVLLNVSVRYWRATKKLNAEDLGLDPDQVTDRLISLGHKKLLPKEALEPFALIESRAHRLVECSTFTFLNGLGHFLPNAKLSEVMARLEAFARAFSEAKAEFLVRYAERRAQGITEWREAAQKLVKNPEQLVATIEASFPAAGLMERHFGYATQLFQIRVPEGLELELVTTADQQHLQHSRDEAARAAAADIRRGVEQFVGDCIASLRQQTAQLCDEMLDSMRSGKTGVHQKTLNRLVTFIDEFKKLNFMGDRQMDTALDKVRQEFLSRTAEEYRDSEFARTKLQDGLQGLRDTARQLATQEARELVERFGALGQRKFHLVA